MDIISHEVIWDHLKEFDMNGRISCGPLTVGNTEAGSWAIAPNPAASQLMILGSTSPHPRNFTSSMPLAFVALRAPLHPAHDHWAARPCIGPVRDSPQ